MGILKSTEKQTGIKPCFQNKKININSRLVGYPTMLTFFKPLKLQFI